MYFFICGILLCLAAFKWGDWRNWKRYYPTILFAILGNMTCELLMYRALLWEYHDVFGKYMVLHIGLMVILYPGMVLLFLTKYPGRPLHQALYVLAWTAGFLLLETVAMRQGTFLHHRGWNLWYTLLHDLIMFLLMRLHFKKPLLAWPASFLMAFLILWHFRLPLEIAR